MCLKLQRILVEEMEGNNVYKVAKLIFSSLCVVNIALPLSVY